MLRTTIQKAYIKRTIRPLYGWTQTTPKSAFLPDNAVAGDTVNVFPGCVMRQVGGDEYDVATDAAHVPAGLSGLYIGGDGIDEVAEAGVNAIAVWVLADDAEFEILAPAFDEADTYAVGTLLSHDAEGKLAAIGGNAVGTAAVAKVIAVVSATKIIIGGLSPIDV